MSRFAYFLVLIVVAILFFVQLNNAAPATDLDNVELTEASLEKRWDDPYYYCCYYNYYKKDGKRSLDKRWKNECKEYYPSWDKREVGKRDEDLEKRWDYP